MRWDEGRRTTYRAVGGGGVGTLWYWIRQNKMEEKKEEGEEGKEKKE